MNNMCDMDPLEGGSGLFCDIVKIEIKQEVMDDQNDNMLPTGLLDVTINEPLELNSTDAIKNMKTGLMVCLHCLEEFHPETLSHHMTSVHNYRRVAFKCFICKLTFESQSVLLGHKAGCKQVVKRAKKKSVKQIIKEVDGYLVDNILENVSCPICILELPKFCLKEHLIMVHSNPEVPVPCSVCNKIFKSNLSLKEHIKLVHNAIEDSAECELCGQKFSSNKYLANHKRNVHPTGNKLHICEVCGKQFKSRLCLHQHTKTVHPPESASVQCPHCHKTFKSKMSLQQHLRVSHGVPRKNSVQRNFN